MIMISCNNFEGQVADRLDKRERLWSKSRDSGAMPIEGKMWSKEGKGRIIADRKEESVVDVRLKMRHEH